MKKTIYMRLEKSTPGAIQYKEVDDNDKVIPQKDAVVGSLYVRKDKIKGTIPEFIKVVITEAEE